MAQQDRINGLVGVLGMKAPVRLATTANITLSGTQTVDGVAAVAGDRILVKNQTSGVDNGIYAVATTAWVREPDFDGVRDAVEGSLVFVTSGSTNGGRLWALTTTAPVIGTSSLTFTQRFSTTASEAAAAASAAAALVSETNAASSASTATTQASNASSSASSASASASTATTQASNASASASSASASASTATTQASNASASASSASASASAAAASAASVNLPDPTVATNMLRVNGGATAYELRTPSQVLADIGAAALAGSASQAFSVGAGGSTVAAAVRQDEIVGRNKIIGGDFTTNPWQRGTSFTALSSGSYGADRWNISNTSAAVVDILKTADAPTPVQSGIGAVYCMHADVTTADASIAAGDRYLIRTPIEGLNAASFGFGQAGTRYVTLSFWHKHTKTGTYCVSFRNSAANRSYVAEYTQSVTDTWEKAVITFPVDTTGTWLYDTGIGLYVSFSIAAGSTFQTAADAWTAGDYQATANQVNALDSTSNNFKIALVQLEAGQVATKFETLDVGTVLRQCQRYLPAVTKASGSNTAPIGSGVIYNSTIAYCQVPFPVHTRVPPTGLTVSATNAISVVGGGASFTSSAITFSYAGYEGAQIEITSAGMTAGHGCVCRVTGTETLFFTGCEL